MMWKKNEENEMILIEPRKADRLPPKQSWMKETPLKKHIREIMESLGIGDVIEFPIAEKVHDPEKQEYWFKKYGNTIDSVRAMHRQYGKKYRKKRVSGSVWVARVAR